MIQLSRSSPGLLDNPGKTMKPQRPRLAHSLLLTAICLLSLHPSARANAAAGRLKPQIMGIELSMSREAARVRLQTLGSLEREDRKRQEVWAIRDPRISHLLVGYDAENRVRYVTALARTGANRIRYDEVADPKRAQRQEAQGNYRFTWEVEERRGQFAYVVIAHGRDPQYLESYSVKKVEEKEID
jgi:hypothetical protein